MIPIDHESKFSAVWSMLDIFCCLTSSYVYAWVACFGTEGTEILSVLTVVYEVIFTLTIAVNFLTNYTPDGETIKVQDLAAIAVRYRKGQFTIDIIAWFPLVFFLDNSKNRFYRLLYIIKIIRLFKGFQVFNVSELMDRVKHLMQVRLENRML